MSDNFKRQPPPWLGRMGFLHGAHAVGSVGEQRWAIKAPSHGVWLTHDEPRVGNTAWTEDPTQAVLFHTRDEAESMAQMLTGACGFAVYAEEVIE